MMRLSPPGYQRLVQAQQLEVQYGGAEANVAVALANWGADSTYVTKLPEHDLGQAVVDHLRRFGVETDHIVRGGTRLGTYYLEAGVGQRSSKVIYDRANAAVTTLQPEAVDWSRVFDGADWFHWTGITPALGDTVQACIERACRAAREAGATISCDLNYRGKLWTEAEARAAMRPLMEHVDVCIASVDEADTCLDVRVDDGASDRAVEAQVAEALREAFDFYVVAMTMREGLSASRHAYGAFLLDDGDCAEGYLTSEYEVEIVDRVGGGDAFAAGLIMGLLERQNTKRAVDFAVASAALKHTIPGDANLVSKAEVEQLMEGGVGRVER